VVAVLRNAVIAISALETLLGVTAAPRTPAHHAIPPVVIEVGIFLQHFLRVHRGLIPILAPLPHISPHVIQPGLIRRETSDGRRVFVFVNLEGRVVIARALRRRPLVAPRILAIPGRGAPFLVRGEAVFLILADLSLLAFLLREPRAKRLRVPPALIHHRVVPRLLEPRAQPAPVHAGIRVRISLVIPHPRVPDAEEHIRPRHWHEPHPQ